MNSASIVHGDVNVERPTVHSYRITRPNHDFVTSVRRRSHGSELATTMLVCGVR